MQGKAQTNINETGEPCSVGKNTKRFGLCESPFSVGTNFHYRYIGLSSGVVLRVAKLFRV